MSAHTCAGSRNWAETRSRHSSERRADRPEARGAQRALARDITARTHGEAVAAQAEADSEDLFSNAQLSDTSVLQSLFDSTGGFTFTEANRAAGVAALLADAGLVASRGEARRLIAGGGVTIDGTRVSDPAYVPELIAGEWLDVRIGKRRRAIGRRVG